VGAPVFVVVRCIAAQGRLGQSMNQSINQLLEIPSGILFRDQALFHTYWFRLHPILARL
jgi:hypothetical protein